MRYSIMGFSQEIAAIIKEIVDDKGGKKRELSLDYTDLAVLRWFTDFLASGKMTSIEIEGTKYYHILYDKLLADMPLINCNKKNLAERLKKLVQLKVLKHHFYKELGSQSFYSMGDRFIDLIHNDFTAGYSSRTSCDQNNGGYPENGVGVSRKQDRGFPENRIGGFPKTGNNNLINNNIIKIEDTNTISIKSASCQPKETKNNDEAAFIGNSNDEVDHGSCPDDDPFGVEVDIQKTDPLQDTQGTENNTLNLRFDEKTVSPIGNNNKDRKNTVSEQSKANPNNTIVSNTCLTFDEFWDMYDKKVEGKTCKQLYAKIKESDRQKIKETLPVYVNNTPDKQFRKYPATYIRKESWNDDPSVYENTGKQPKDELKSEWADRVLGKVIGKGMKASPEAIAEMKAYEESGDAPF